MTRLFFVSDIRVWLSAAISVAISESLGLLHLCFTVDAHHLPLCDPVVMRVQRPRKTSQWLFLLETTVAVLHRDSLGTSIVTVTVLPSLATGFCRRMLVGALTFEPSVLVCATAFQSDLEHLTSQCCGLCEYNIRIWS